MKLVLIIFFLILKLTNLFSFEEFSLKYYKSENLFRKGVYYFNQGDYTLSSKYFLRALSYKSDDYRFRYWLAKSYYYAGYMTEARREWKYLMNYFHWKEPVLNYHYQSYFYDDFLSEHPSFDEKDKKYIPVHPIFENSKVFNLKDSSVSTLVKNPTSVYWDGYYHQYWIVGYGSNNVVILNRNGMKINELLGSKDMPFKNPYDIVMNSKGELFISDTGNHQVHKFIRTGGNKITYLKSFGFSKFQDLHFKFPKGLYLDNQDFIYVVDSGNHRIQKLDSEGNLLFSFGLNNTDEKNLSSPTDVLVFNNYVYITDTGNSRIQIYDLSGNWVKTLKAKNLLDPRGLKLINNHYILVSDLFNNNLWIIDTELLTLRSFKLALKNNQRFDVITPSDVFIDNNNYLYALDFENSSFKIFIPENLKYNNLHLHILSSFYNVNSTLTNFISKAFSSFLSLINNSSIPILRKDIIHKVLVKDQFGNSLHGLDKYNFKIKDNDKEISMDNFEVYEKRNVELDAPNIIYILQEKTFSMKKRKEFFDIFLEQLVQYIQLNNLNIQFKVIQYNSSYWVPDTSEFSIDSELYMEKLINLKNGLSMFYDNPDEKFPTANNIKAFGEAFYESINRLLKEQPFNRRAVFVFNYSKAEVDSFSHKSFENCLFYPKNNQIPVYVFSFRNEKDAANNSHKDLLEILSKKTNGLYFNFYNPFDMKKVFDHYFYETSSVYYIKHPIFYFEKNSNYWNSLFIEVGLKELFGSDISDYYLDF